MPCSFRLKVRSSFRINKFLLLSGRMDLSYYFFNYLYLKAILTSVTTSFNFVTLYPRFLKNVFLIINVDFEKV